MQRFIKFTVISLLVIIIGAGVASVLLSHFIDPNQYKDRITRMISEKTGYQIALNGNIAWSLFPMLGISVDHIDVKAREDAPAFLAVEQATVSVKLLPLLDKQIEMDAVSIDGFTMTLLTDERGAGNWQSNPQINRKKTSSPLPQAEVVNTLASTQVKKPQSDLAIDIAAIDIQRGNILYDDRSTKQRIHISNLSLTGKQISSTTPFPINGGFDVEVANPSIRGHIDTQANGLLNLQTELFNFSNIIINSQLSGDVFSGNAVNFQTTGNITVDQVAQKILLSKVTIDLSNLKINTTVDYNLRNLEYKGTIDIPAFSITEFKKSIGMAAQDENNILPMKLALDGDIAGNDHYVFFNNIQLLFEDIPFTARAGISSFESGALDVTLNGTQVDIEKLLSALGKQPQLSGLLTFSTHITTGAAGDTLTQKLSGTGQFDIANAVLKGENLTQKICDAIALINQTASSQSRTTDTHFDALKGTFIVQNGVVHSNDLTAQTTGAAAKATLTSDLNQQTILADIGITVTGDSDDIACQVNDNFKNVVLPITCNGTYQTEAGKLCSVNKEGLANVAKGTFIEKATQKIENKFGPAVKGTLDKLFGQ